MDTLSKRYILLFFAILLAVAVGAYLIDVMKPPAAKPIGDNYQSSSYYTVQDDLGNIILETGLPVSVNDEFISDKNLHYIVNRVESNLAWASIKEAGAASGQGVVQSQMTAFSMDVIPAQAPPKNIHVVIYHTHSDESYVPTSGTPSKPGDGDIYSVGNALADAFELNGISTTHSYNPHDPHDVNAYHRSRRTVAQLLTEQPDAAFDIHRDSAPAESYQTTINGIPTSRVMIVVGRSNPNFQTNLDFAVRVKDVADTLHPGLTRGIFIGHGDYNQDLYPTALLFETGTEGVSLLAAERAIRSMGDALIYVLQS